MQKSGPVYHLVLDKDTVDSLKKLHLRIQEVVPFTGLQPVCESHDGVSTIQAEDKKNTKSLKIFQRAATQFSKQTLL